MNSEQENEYLEKFEIQRRIEIRNKLNEEENIIRRNDKKEIKELKKIIKLKEGLSDKMINKIFKDAKKNNTCPTTEYNKIYLKNFC